MTQTPGSLDNLALSEDPHHHHHPDHEVSQPGVLTRVKRYLFGYTVAQGGTMINTLNVGDRVSELKPDLRAIRNSTTFLALGGLFLGTLGFGVTMIKLLVRFRKLPRKHILGILTEPHYRPPRMHTATASTGPGAHHTGSHHQHLHSHHHHAPGSAARHAQNAAPTLAQLGQVQEHAVKTTTKQAKRKKRTKNGDGSKAAPQSGAGGGPGGGEAAKKVRGHLVVPKEPPEGLCAPSHWNPYGGQKE